MVHLQEFGPAKVSLLVQVRSLVGFLCVCVFFLGKLIRVLGLIHGIVVVVVRSFFLSSIGSHFLLGVVHVIGLSFFSFFPLRPE